MIENIKRIIKENHPTYDELVSFFDVEKKVINEYLLLLEQDGLIEKVKNRYYLTSELNLIPAVIISIKEKSLYLTLVQSKNKNQIYHVRECIPSIIISRMPLMDILLDLLKDGNQETIDLMNILQTVPTTIVKIKSIATKKKFDYNTLFQNNYPELFLYNMKALRSQFTKDLRFCFERTGGFTFLIKSCNNTLLVPEIIEFLSKGMTEEMKINYSQQIYTNFIQILPELSDFNLTICNDTMNFLLSIAQLSPSFNIPDSFPLIMKHLLFHKEKNVQKQFSKFLSLINISFDKLLELLPKESKDIKSAYYYFTALLPHINHYSKELLQIVKENVIDNIPLLNILLRYLELDLVEEEDKIYFTNILMERYLNVDEKPKCKEYFLPAVMCLSKLQNKTLVSHLEKIFQSNIKFNVLNIDGDSFEYSNSKKSGLIQSFSNFMQFLS